jgi:hypothetical protein
MGAQDKGNTRPNAGIIGHSTGLRATVFDPSLPAASLLALNLEGAERRHLANRLLRRLNLARRAALRPAIIATLKRLSEPEFQRRMLFVVGAARSGTTGMQNAFNASDHVFLLGEANLFRENLKPGFRKRYNDRHIGNGLPPSKQTDCPSVALEEGTWVETMTGLLARYRFVGEKVAFGAFQPERYVSEFLAFQRRHFAGAAYVLMFRNPRDAILSPRSAWGIQELAPWAMSYMAGTRGLLRLRCRFARTVPVFLESIGPPTFTAIENCLGASLPRLSSVMLRKAESPPGAQPIPAELRETLAELEGLYPQLREAVVNSDANDDRGSLLSIDARLDGLRRRLGGELARG